MKNLPDVRVIAVEMLPQQDAHDHVPTVTGFDPVTKVPFVTCCCPCMPKTEKMGMWPQLHFITHLPFDGQPDPRPGGWSQLTWYDLPEDPVPDGARGARKSTDTE